MYDETDETCCQTRPRPSGAARRRSRLAGGLALAFALGAVPSRGEPAQAQAAPWSTARHDLQRTARSPVTAAQTLALQHAPRSSGSSAVPSAAVEGLDGTVYFSNGGALRAVDPSSGSTSWSVPATGNRKISAAAVGPDGTLHVSQTGGSLPALVVALAPDGAQRWVYTTPEPEVYYFSDLAVDAAGRVFGRYLEFQFTYWHAFCLDDTGQLVWKTSVPYTSEFSPTPPAQLADGDLVFTAVDHEWDDRLMRLDAETGAIEWSVVPGGSLSAPVVADNGLVLVHSPGLPPANGISAFDPDTGALVWSVPYLAMEYGEDNPPVLLPDGTIVAIANGDNLGNRLIYRISPDGALLGTAPYPSTGYYTEAISGGDGTLYVWSSMRLIAFSPTSGALKFEYYPAPTSSCLRNSQATILSDGSLFGSWQRKQTCNSPSAFGEFVTLAPPGFASYCTAGTSASGCQATLSAAGTPSATAASGFVLSAAGVEGDKSGLYFYGTSGRQANPWGSGTSYQCVVPPVIRGGLLPGTGTLGLCDGSFSQDMNALWTAKPAKNPGSGAVVCAQLWYRDPQNSSNQATSLSDAIEVTVFP